MNDERNATPAEMLERRIMDPCVAKSEAEWWAKKEIEKQRAEVEKLREALHRISLASQNSMSSKAECGRIARETLEDKS